MLSFVSKSEFHHFYDLSSSRAKPSYSIIFPVESRLQMLESCLEPNWDGEGAPPISRGTLQNAQCFLKQLPRGTPKVDVAPGIDGSIGMLWETTDTYIYVDIKPEGRVHYYYQLEGEQSQEEVLATPFQAPVLYQCLNRAFWFMTKNQSVKIEKPFIHPQVTSIISSPLSFLKVIIPNSKAGFRQFAWR